MRYTSIKRLPMAVAVAFLASGCASAPPAKPPAAPQVPLEQKMSWILRLEDQRILRQSPPAPPPVDVVTVKGKVLSPPPPPAVNPDLVNLLNASEGRIRRRAALAIGRVGLPAGVQPLVAKLSDTDPDVREMAAFALGLIGDGSAVTPLTTALTDTSPIVRGRAAEALGLIDAKEKDQVTPDSRRDVGAAIGRMVVEYAKTPVVSSITADDEKWPAPPEAEAFRLGIYALVRLGTYEPLAAAVLDSGGQPIVNWWPVAYALGRIEDRRAAPALLRILNAPGKYSAAFAARGLGALKETAAVNPLMTIAGTPAAPQEVVVSAIRALAAIGDSRGSAPLLKLASDAQDPNV